MLAGCGAAHPSTLTYVGQQQVPFGERFDDTVIGGLSAISYDAHSQQYYVISDDKGEHGPVRFYTVALTLSGGGIGELRFTGMHPLRDVSGQPFASNAQPDAEGIAVDPGRGQLYWSSEGGRPHGGAPVVPQPWIRIAGLDGGYRGAFELPPGFFLAAQSGSGQRPNKGLEGLTLTPDGRRLFAGLEEPLYGDPDRLSRITEFDVETRKPLAQYAYRLDSAPDGRKNGLSDLVAVSDREFLVIERAGGPRPRIRIYRAEIGSATDTLAAPDLTRAVPMSKRLIADMTASGGPRPLDNVEGVTLGPSMPNGRQSVVFVSDNNFSPRQVTQFLLFAWQRTESGQ
jgi:hypothetical protein